jgi:general secretion pathway protein L
LIRIELIGAQGIAMHIAGVSAARPGSIYALTAWWQRFTRWWLSGLREAVPPGWLNWADGEAMSKVMIWRDHDVIVCRLISVAGEVEGRVPYQHFDAAVLGAWLADHGLKREQVVVGPVVPRDQFFLRDLSVPKAALGALPKILDQEVLRKTPFQPSDILHAATVVAEGATDVLAMCHWIIRKDRAEKALADLGLKSSQVDFLAVDDASGEAHPVIAFREASDEEPAWVLRAVRLLAVAGLGVVMLGLAAFEWSQASVAASVETSLVEARQGAQSGRDGISPTARLRALKADAGILEVWDELSRILPDHTFLTESRIADGKVTLSGFSADAARLVRIIDQSPLFSGATLTAAITPDATERKDRFSISFKVRGGRTVRPPGSARSSAS